MSLSPATLCGRAALLSVLLVLALRGAAQDERLPFILKTSLTSPSAYQSPGLMFYAEQFYAPKASLQLGAGYLGGSLYNRDSGRTLGLRGYRLRLEQRFYLAPLLKAPHNYFFSLMLDWKDSELDRRATFWRSEGQYYQLLRYKLASKVYGAHLGIGLAKRRGPLAFEVVIAPGIRAIDNRIVSGSLPGDANPVGAETRNEETDYLGNITLADLYFSLKVGYVF